MPQGPDHWHEFWEGDEKPTRYLSRRGFKCTGGLIYHPEGRPLDCLDKAAIEYLIAEWDYGYEQVQEDRHR